MLVVVGCLRPAGLPSRADGADQATARCSDIPSCERALLAPSGPTPELLAAYGRLRPKQQLSAAWRLFVQAQRSKTRSLVVAFGNSTLPTALRPATRLQLPAQGLCQSVPDRLLLRSWAQAAHLETLVLLHPKTATIAYPRDPLAPFAAGLFAQIASTPSQLAEDLALGDALHALLSSMKDYAFLPAHKQAQSLLAKVLGPALRPATLRAAFVLGLLDAAGIKQARPLPPTALLNYQPRHPYDAWLAARLAPQARQASAWRQRIVPHLPARFLPLLQKPGSAPSCTEQATGSIDRIADLALLQLPRIGLRALAAKSTGEVDRAAFNKAVSLANASSAPWAFLQPLLAAEAGLKSPTPQRHKALHLSAKKHVAALAKLAQQSPEALSPGSIVNMMYNAGVARDPQLREPLLLLAEDLSVGGLEKAANPGQALRAALASFALAMSLPMQLQRGQYAALAGMLRKLSRHRFQRAQGWDAAALHLTQAVATHWAGSSQHAASAKAIRYALAPAAQATTNGHWARLAQVATRYVALFGRGDLNATVSNPRMFSEDRRRARSQVKAALKTLSPQGPQKPPARELLNVLADLTDGVIAAAGHLMKAPPSSNCAGASAIPSHGELRDMVERLRKRRRRLLALGALHQGQSPWLEKARVLALLLSDIIDGIDRKARPRWRVQHQQAQRWLHQASGAPATPSAALASSYLVLRTLFGSTKEDAQTVSKILRDESAVALEGMGRLFRTSRENSVFRVLAAPKRTGSQALRGDTFSRYAERAYASGQEDQGDMLLLLSLTASVMRSTAVASEAIQIAQRRKRPVLSALLLHHRPQQKSPARVRELRRLSQAACAPAPAGTAIVLQVQGALQAFRNGRRRRALNDLRRALVQAEQKGLHVPRQTFRYAEQAGPVLLQLEHGISFGRHLLAGSDSFRIGLGFVGQDEASRSGLATALSSANSPSSRRDALDYFIHATAVASILHDLSGERAHARRYARNALSGWASGLRLGTTAYRPSASRPFGQGAAKAMLALLAQQAIEAQEPMLGGALLSLLRKALGPKASDASIERLPKDLPPALGGIAELPQLASRSQATLKTLVAPLRCTQHPGEAKKLLLASCGRYAKALALRIADALPRLPRLKGARYAKSPRCLAYKALDRFLSAAAERRYQPRRFSAAVAALHRAKLNDTAGDLLANQRLAKHCSQSLVAHARSLGADPSLGKHLRASLWSVAVRCAPPEKVGPDLLVLSQLTSQLADPLRHFEVLVYAAKLALRGHPRPLSLLVKQAGFVAAWQRRSAALGALALVLRQAGLTLVERGASKTRRNTRDPAYAQLCRSDAQHGLQSVCSSISFLMSKASLAERKAAAKESLLRFVGTGSQLLRPPPAASPPPKR